MYASRRRFLQSTAAGSALAGLGDISFLAQLPRVSAEEAQPASNVVQLRPEIEPLVKLLETTPRQQVLEVFADRIRHGTSYNEVLTALLLAGVRNIQPRPTVGFKFHAVLVVNSAHLASISSPDEHRWLPIFWALDEFKSSQAADVNEGNWTMSPVDESAVPSARKAHAAFREAMDKWDVSAADAAVAGLARTAGAQEVFELFARYGARDFRDIGHKAIYVANSWRTLQCIGWQHAEPVLRSLAYALLNHGNGDNPSTSDLAPDRPWRSNEPLAAQIRGDWLDGKVEQSATRELLETLRTASDEECCAEVVKLLNRGVSPQSIWDALFVGAGELLVRQPGIVALHAVTSTNALAYAWQASGDDQTRRMMLLQNAAFVPLFREAMKGRGELKEFQIEQFAPGTLDGSGEAAVEEIFAAVSGDRMSAAGKILAYVKDHPEPKPLIDMARVLVFLKGNNSHDYKYSSAVFEDYRHISSGWRDLFLASSVFQLRGSKGPDNALVQRTRAALA